MLTVIEKVILLQNVDVFSDIPTEQLAQLAAIAETVSVPQGDTIYREHDHADSLYLTLEGQVRLHREDREILVAGPQEVFGTWALFDDAPRVVTATALEDTRLLRIDRDDFFDLLADDVQVTRGILQSLARRLRRLVERIGVDAPARRET